MLHIDKKTLPPEKWLIQGKSRPVGGECARALRWHWFPTTVLLLPLLRRVKFGQVGSSLISYYQSLNPSAHYHCVNYLKSVPADWSFYHLYPRPVKRLPPLPSSNFLGLCPRSDPLQSAARPTLLSS